MSATSKLVAHVAAQCAHVGPFTTTHLHLHDVSFHATDGDFMDEDAARFAIDNNTASGKLVHPFTVHLSRGVARRHLKDLAYKLTNDHGETIDMSPVNRIP